MAISFADRVKKYNEGKTETVPVNPPEAAKVLEEKVAPEVAGAAEPGTSAPAALPSAQPSDVPSELTKGQKAAKTRAENRARSAEAPPATQDTPAQPASTVVEVHSAEVLACGITHSLVVAIRAVQGVLPEGCTLTIQGRWKD